MKKNLKLLLTMFLLQTNRLLRLKILAIRNRRTRKQISSINALPIQRCQKLMLSNSSNSFTKLCRKPRGLRMKWLNRKYLFWRIKVISKQILMFQKILHLAKRKKVWKKKVWKKKVWKLRGEDDLLKKEKMKSSRSKANRRKVNLRKANRRNHNRRLIVSRTRW